MPQADTADSAHGNDARRNGIGPNAGTLCSMPSDVAAEPESWSGRVTAIRWIASAQEGIEHLQKNAVERVDSILARLAG